MAVTYRGPVGSENNFTPRRAISVDKALWDAYGAVVGTGGRSADLRTYIEWRVDNPTTPLPGKRVGPVKRDRPEPSSDT